MLFIVTDLNATVFHLTNEHYDEPSLKEFFPVCFKEKYFAYCSSRTEIFSNVLTPRICENKCREIIFRRITGLPF